MYMYMYIYGDMYFSISMYLPLHNPKTDGSSYMFLSPMRRLLEANTSSGSASAHASSYDDKWTSSTLSTAEVCVCVCVCARVCACVCVHDLEVKIPVRHVSLTLNTLNRRMLPCNACLVPYSTLRSMPS